MLDAVGSKYLQRRVIIAVTAAMVALATFSFIRAPNCRVVKAPDSCCDNLFEMAFKPHYVTIQDIEFGPLRMHMVDEGPHAALAVVMVHGNPTWSYMWRKLIPVIVDAGLRAIAVDLIGMGRSDKLTEPGAYSLSRHASWLQAALFDVLQLDRVCFILTDWGSTIGQRVIAEHRLHTAGLVLMNGAPLIFHNSSFAISLGSWRRWLQPYVWMVFFYQTYLKLFNGRWDRHWDFLGGLLNEQPPDPRVIAGFAAPYASRDDLAANTKFPLTIPTFFGFDACILADNRAAAQRLQTFNLRHLVILSERDGVMGDGILQFTNVFSPWFTSAPPTIIPGTNHFLLEDNPQAVIPLIMEFLRETR